MNSIKRQIIWFSVTGATGLIFLITSIFIDNEGFIGSIGVGLFIVSGMRILQYRKIMKNPELKKAYEIKQSEERTVYIANKSRSLMFALSIYVEFIAVLIAGILKQNDISTVISIVICIQLVIYLIVFYYYNKKY